MKAITYDKGSPGGLKCEEIPQPAAGEGEVLLKVRAAAVNPLDWRVLHAGPYLRRFMSRGGKAKVAPPGVDVAGQVESVGGNATQFKPGDEVFGVCRGAFAEYACAPESKLVIKPANLTFEQAASTPVAALTALQGLRDKGRLQPGQKVLINGAAGGVGTFAVQIAKVFGAHVTGVCSTRNLEMVRSIGADRVLDYTREDFTKGEATYDLIFDLVANHSFSACRRVLNAGGSCVLAGAKGIPTIAVRAITAPVLSRVVNQKFVVFIARISQADLTTLGELMAAGKVTPVIDRRYRLTEVPEAVRYVEQGHARGKVVITLQ